jgi:hypothetical protein
MDLIPVKSSNLLAVGYDAKTKTLRVLFKTNELYEYKNIEPEMHSGLMAASSPGGYFSKFIKALPFEKIKKPAAE